jgi:2-hydroxy-6-oxonona-2,4-dienedioate hydrolase
VSIWTDLTKLRFRQTFYDAKGVRTRAIEAGEGEPLIFLHGTGGHAEAFTRNLAAHAEHMRVLSVDMIGHGYTDAPDVEYTMDLLVEHLGNLIDAVGSPQVSLSGESLGALVAAHYAIKYPQRVKKLVMNTGILMPFREEDKDALRDMLERTRRATGELTREAVRARLAWLMHEPEKSVTEELIDVRYHVYAQPGRAAIIGRITQFVIGGLLDDAWTAKYSSPEPMRKIECPTLVTWTRYNPGQTVDTATEGMKYLKNGRLEVFEKSAHWPQWEEHERYNNVHVKFLTA